MKPKLVVVDWIDSCSGNRWESIESAKEEPLGLDCRSVGWLIHQTKRTVVIAPNRTSALTSVLSAINIPRVAISRMRTLREPK